MVFQTKDLESKIVAIVEVGSYRIKVCVCEFKNDKVNILAYSEKRQSTSYFVNGECKNLEMLGMGIKDALKKTEKDYGLTIEDIIINFPFGELFFYSNKLSYKRENERHLITKDELQRILKKTEKIILQKCFKRIEKNSGYIETDLKLIISSIINIKIDKHPYERIVGETGEDMSISLVNMFIPMDKSNHIKYIGEIINKNITKIIPTEFALKNLFEEKDIIIIHLGAIYTTITIKSEGKITGISKIPIGVNDLSQMIASEHKSITSNEILKNIDTGSYTDKEQDFLDIWKRGLMVGVKEILGDDVCPKNFHVMSDISTEFIEKSIGLIDFNTYNVKLVNKMHFLDIKEAHIESQIENCDDFEISPEIAAMILELKNLIKKEKSVLVKSLKKAVLELGYID